MSKIGKRSLLIMVFCTLITLMLPTTSLANSARQPSIYIIVKNPPKDFSIILINSKWQEEGKGRPGVLEGSYAFYNINLKSTDQYTFKVTANGENFECKLVTPLQRYTNEFSLDIQNRELIPGRYPFRDMIAILLQLLLTLLIEGSVFWIFNYRQKRSWVVFLCVNLVTQGALNIWFDSYRPTAISHYFDPLAIGEFFVFIAEMIMFPVLIKEHNKKRSLVYALTANFVSLFLGSIIFELLY